MHAHQVRERCNESFGVFLESFYIIKLLERLYVLDFLWIESILLIVLLLFLSCKSLCSRCLWRRCGLGK
jgi:hypothetical protein